MKEGRNNMEEYSYYFDDDEVDGSYSSDDHHHHDHHQVEALGGVHGAAEEYLRAVREEAAHLPEILVADVGNHYHHEDNDGRKEDEQASTTFTPTTTTTSIRYSRQGFDSFVSDFGELRSKLSSANVVSQTMVTKPKLKNASQSLLRAFCSEGPPLLSVVLPIEEPVVALLLQMLVEEVTSEADAVVEERHARWIFALAARIEKPLNEDSSASFRSLVKYCVDQLEKQSHPNGRLVDEQESDRLLLLLAISGAYFGQDEVLTCRFSKHQRL